MEFHTDVDMISVCSADGSLEPLRFRYEDREQATHRGRILEILSSREIKYVQVEAFEYTCRAQVEDRIELLRVRYAIRTHRWSLLQLVN